MKLPNRGFLVNPDGEIIWAWEQNDPTREFESYPPSYLSFDGQLTWRSNAASSVVDLDEEDLSSGDLADLHSNLHEARFRKRPDGSFRLTKIIGTDSEGNLVEVDHPIIDIINLKREKAGKPPHRKGS